MPRQTGLGRGLAALLPNEYLGEADDDSPRDHGARQTVVLSDELAAEVAANESGLALIYRALDGLVAQYGLEDAAVVVEEAGLGRQVFRAGRKPLDDEDEALLFAEPGLYTRPELDDDQAFDRSLVLSICVLALRLDMLRYDAWHDPLTGLYDRRSFDRLLEMAVSRSTRYGWPFTLVLLDLDDFKALNDREGHASGDAALRDLGERFRRALRFGDNASRIGGDEFAMVLPDTDPDRVPVLLERLRHAPGFDTECPSFSWGSAQCPKESEDAEALFRLADARLYEAKERR